MLGSFMSKWLASGDDTATPSTTDELPSPVDLQQDDTIGSDDGDTTPKAKAAQSSLDVPTFTLAGEDVTTPEEPPEEQHNLVGTPSAGSMLSEQSGPQQQASARPVPHCATPANATKNVTAHMPPPSRPAASNSLQPNAASSLRIPSSGPLPNRGPPANSQQRASSGLSANGAIPVPNPRGKVLLAPGHSPMDWAALTRKGNISGVSSFQRVTPSQLRTMTGRKGKPAWSSWQGKVYNITPYLPFHPGGKAELMKAAGRDGTKLFMDVHPWVNWENMLSATIVGVMVPEDFGQSPLEDMD